MKSNFFFLKKKLKIKDIYPKLKIKNTSFINDVKTLQNASINDLTFFDNVKYKLIAKKTKASFCITTKKLHQFLPNHVEKILVNNVLLELASVLKNIYPNADIDYPDLSLNNPNKKNYKHVKFGNNVLIGKNVKIGRNTVVGTNSIIEHSVVLGKNCVIGSNVILKNTTLAAYAMRLKKIHCIPFTGVLEELKIKTVNTLVK